MLDEALTEIFRNMPGDGSDEWEKTFFGFLSEFGDWHVEKFWVFHKALIDIGKKVDKKGSVDRELSYALLYIQDSVLTHIASHFDPAIDWQFTSIAGEEIHGFKERFELAILGAISGEVIPETSFDLINPLIKNG